MRIGLIRWESIITSRPECRGRIPVILINPLSRFPQGGKAGCGAPSPLGEGWEGGIYINLIHICQQAYKLLLLIEALF